MTVPDWLVNLVGRQAIEVEGMRDAVRRLQEENQLLTAQLADARTDDLT